MFHDRREAGQRLAAHLLEEGITGDIVLAVPRGGLPVAREVATALAIPLDVVVARKIGAPGNPELALGAVASDGSAWLNAPLIDRLGVETQYLEQHRRAEAENAHQKYEYYRGQRPLPQLTGKIVLLVDDGVATGATTVACVRFAYQQGAAQVVVAVPVAPSDTVEFLDQEADKIVAVETPSRFMAVGQFYQIFGQVDDEEALACLESSDHRSSGDM